MAIFKDAAAARERKRKREQPARERGEPIGLFEKAANSIEPLVNPAERNAREQRAKQETAALAAQQAQEETNINTPNDRTGDSGEGDAFIREREKLAAQIQQSSGATNKQALAQATQQINQSGTSFKQVGAGEFAEQNIPGKPGQASVSLPGDSLLTTGALGARGIAAGITAGASIGAIGGIPGAVIGGIAGGVVGFLAALSSDKRQATKEAYKVFQRSSGEQYNEILRAANNGLPAADAIRLYETNLANIRVSQAALKRETRTAVGRQLSGAQDELLAVELYLQNEQLYRMQLLQALASPNPNSLMPSISPTMEAP